MAQRKATRNDEELWDEPMAFLQRRGIVPANGSFTRQQLARELTRRGWQWRMDAGRVEATKSYTPTGTVSTRIVSDESDPIAGLATVLADAIRFDDRHGLLLTGPIDADIVIRAPDQRVIAIGEVKGGQSLSADLATEYRNELVSFSKVFALAPFFLMIWRDVGYLWDQRAGTIPRTTTAIAFPMAPVVAHYLPWLREGERPGATEIALAVAHWLEDLAHPVPNRPVPAVDVFAETDFLDAIQGASVLTDAAA